MALLEAILQFVAEVHDAGHVHFEHAVDVSAGAAGLDHALRDDLAHLRHWNSVARYGGRGGSRRTRCGWSGGGRRSRRPLFEVIEDVLLGDAATGSSSLDLIQVDIVLASKFANQRRGANIGFIVRA